MLTWMRARSKAPINDDEISVWKKHRLRTLSVAGGRTNRACTIECRAAIIAVGTHDRTARAAGVGKVSKSDNDAANSRAAGKIVDYHPRFVRKDRAARGLIDNRRRTKRLTAVERSAKKDRAAVETRISRAFGGQKNCSLQVNARDRIAVAIIYSARQL